MVYIWRDCKHKRYYIGSHWGIEGDGYICSSSWMKKAYKYRSEDFRGPRLLKTKISTKEEMYLEEQRWFDMIKKEEIAPYSKTPRYYNLTLVAKPSGFNHTGPRPCTPEKATAISTAKKAKFAERGGMSEEHKAALRGPRSPQHTEEWKAENGKRKKEWWDSEAGQALKAKRAANAEPKEQRAKGERLKELWSDPLWKEQQRRRLSEGASNRPPRSEESKQRARIAQLGISKPRKVSS